MDGQPEHRPRAQDSARPVFHPAVGDADRQTLLRHPDLLAPVGDRERATRDPRVSSASDSAQIISLLTFIASCLGVLGLLALEVRGRFSGGHAVLSALTRQLGLGIAVVLLLCPLALAASLVGSRRARSRQARVAALAARLRKHYVLPREDLDEPCCALLARARAAAETAAQAQNGDAESADVVAGRAVLPHLLWDLADELAEHTRQRRLIERLAPDAGPATKAALAPRTEALDRAAAALRARVTALEAYARRLAELDAARRDLATARALAAQDPTLDLISRRTLDAFAAEDIARLSEPVAAHRDEAALEASGIAEYARQLTELVARAVPADPPRTPQVYRE
jgi:hypothetical protein